MYVWESPTLGPPEKHAETVAAEKIWSKFGFRSAPLIQQRLAGGVHVPDLIDRVGGVVGDVKRRVGPGDGPPQVRRYLDWLNKNEPRRGGWRAVLIQNHSHDRPDLSDAAKAALAGLPVKVFSIEVRRVRGPKVRRVHG
jgi:hypothetical protein